MQDSLRVEFWQGRYDTGNMPWDLGGPSPHFEELLSRKPGYLRPGRMAVLGSGQGHDAALFANHHFEVTGFDYAPGAIERSIHRYGDVASFIQADIFELADPASPWTGQFDIVLEHTCFCAIFPHDRPRYVATARNLLKPGGLVLGVFWEHADTDGPPFSTTEADIRKAFAEGFEVVSLEACPPVAGRSGVEWLAVLRRLPDTTS